MGPEMSRETGADGKGLYIAAGTAALAVVLSAVTDIVMSFMPGGASAAPGALNVEGWFALFHERWFMGLRNLGLFNMLNTVLAVPVFLALYGLHRRKNGGFAALALLLLSVGAAAYVGNNAAFPLFSLSREYAAAAGPERGLLVAAGKAVLAQSEDLTPGTFPGFFLTETAGIVMALVVLRGGIFGAAAGAAGIAAYVFLLAFNVLAAFVPGAFGAAMACAGIGGLAAIAWYVLLARKLFELGKRASG